MTNGGVRTGHDAGGAPPRFEKCEDIAEEACRLAGAGHVTAADALLNPIRETCLFGPSPCPRNSACRQAVARAERLLAARPD